MKAAALGGLGGQHNWGHEQRQDKKSDIFCDGHEIITAFPDLY